MKIDFSKLQHTATGKLSQVSVEGKVVGSVFKANSFSTWMSDASLGEYLGKMLWHVGPLPTFNDARKAVRTLVKARA